MAKQHSARQPSQPNSTHDYARARHAEHLIEVFKSRKVPQNSAQARGYFVQDLDLLFQACLLAGQYAAALKAKELIGKEGGFFAQDKKGALLPDLDKLSDAELQSLVDEVAEVATADVPA